MSHDDKRKFIPFAITDTHVCDTTPQCPICRMEKGLNADERYELWKQRRAAEAAAKRE